MARQKLPQGFILFLIVFTLFSPCVSAQSNSQNDSQNLSADLNQKFRKFDLVKTTPQTAFREILNNKNLKIKTNTESFELRLRPRNLLSPNYRAEETGANGIKRTLPAPKLNTYQGEIIGEEGSRVRLTISEREIEGLIVRGGINYFIEPAKRFSESASDKDFIVYRTEDLLVQTPLHCESLAHKIGDATKNYLPQAEQFVSAQQAMKVAEIATEADFQFVNELGGATNANREILNILNVIEGVYENQLGVTFSVTFQHVWTAADPYPAEGPEAALEFFKNYWNSNFPAGSYSRDTAHLFSSKDALRGRGHAYLNTICRPEVAYGLHGRFPYGTAKYTVPAHELAHNFNANHVDASQSCDNTVMNATLTTETPLTFCQASRSELIGSIASGAACFPTQQFSKTKFDFDRDSKADFSVFRPATGDWYLFNSGLNSFHGARFGQLGDRPVSEDYDGDRVADIAVFRAGIWYILNSSNNAFRAVGFGLPSDIPVPADYTGDGRAEVAVFRPNGGFWYKLDLSNNSFSGLQFGTEGDVPAPEDFDGDGKEDISVFRPTTGFWYRLNSSTGQFAAAFFGRVGDRPVPADYDGDGRADVAVFRPGANANWYILRSSDGGFGGAPFGVASDLPVPADYDGDGRADIAVFRDGAWYCLNSFSGAFTGNHFGTGGDVPIPFR
ncbi:MAG: FG-GAP-like repeat-containing protein [Acidobacteriota bacterium]|nr:FG-GAP-like repeat-containing protein [Acidobacteriota bacterium]